MKNNGPRARRFFDCCIFNNEIELLEMRLAILEDDIDVFVIIEANETFSGHPKTLNRY